MNEEPKSSPTSKSEEKKNLPSQEMFHMERRTTNSLNFGSKKLFFTVLIISVGINCYLKWGKVSSSIEQKNTIETLKNQLKESNDLLDLIKKDQIEIERMFSISKIIQHARSSTPIIRFASNNSIADRISSIAKAVVAQSWYSCEKNIPVGEYDTYKNCFRDLAIELHNKLEMKMPESHFFVSAGRIHYAFLVTTIHSKRREYFITIGDIMFQLLEYDDLVTSLQEDVDDSQQTINKSG